MINAQQTAVVSEETPTASDAQWAAALTSVTEQIRATDGKSGTLLTGLGLPLAVLTAAVQGRELTTVATVLVGLGGAALVVALLLVLLAVRPFLAPPDTARGSFLYWSKCEELGELVADVAAETTSEHRAERIRDLARLAHRKHALIRHAIHTTIGALVLLGGALLAGLV
ncbi:Pycsar system effector family protein [Kitasatospora sp. NPDC052868]|uniref:Pycsar system effector family protein n=1 Tax=Kitasatospora sp. NPDC052868 TaxID=3364060 RepID=UPI0037C7196C